MLTYDEVLKAAESINAEEKHDYCVHCPSLQSAFRVIEDQKAEIDKMKLRFNSLFAPARGLAKPNVIQLNVDKIKAEAIKEFAERSEKEIFIKQDYERKQMLKILKTYRGTRAYSDTEQATDNWLRGYGEAVQDILSINNNLVKELVGED